MLDRLYVASRKGLLTFDRSGDSSNGGWTMSDVAFRGDPVSAVLHDGRDGTLYAALNLGHFGEKLHRSEDNGKSWTEIAAPAFEKADDDAEGPSVSLIWTLVAGGADQPGRLWAGTIPGGLFRSDDRGDSWSLAESLWNMPEREKWMGGGYDNPGIHSISLDPANSERLALGVSTGGVWLSGDGGESWRLGGKGLRAEYAPPESANDPLYQDVHRLSRCAAAPDVLWLQHHNGIFRSEDGGENFTEITDAKPSVFGFSVAAHPADPKTAWFAPAEKDEFRVPVGRRMVVSRTSDGGASFEVLRNGFPEIDSFDLVYRHALCVDAAGETLAVGSTTGNLWVGEAGGERWTLVSNYLAMINQVHWAE